MKRLFQEAGVLTWLFVGNVARAVVVSMSTVAFADIFGRALSLVVAGSGFVALHQVIIIGVAVGVASVGETFFGKLLAGYFSERLQRNLRDRAVERLAHATATAMHGEHSGDVQSRFSSDMLLLEQLVRTDTLQFVSQGLTAVLAAAYMLSGTGCSRLWPSPPYRSCCWCRHISPSLLAISRQPPRNPWHRQVW